MSRTPCIVITRDRVSLTRLCVASLERFSDQIQIILVDHGSTYMPMIEYLASSPHDVQQRADHPPRALWDGANLSYYVGHNEPYLVTDPDLVFDDACPADWLEQMRAELEREPSRPVKVGMGLRIDDLPDTLLARKVRDWECLFWVNPTPQRRSWHAPVDTTMALYPPLRQQPGFALSPALRMNSPYLMRHLPWYADDFPEETQYYRQHALTGASHWINGGW